MGLICLNWGDVRSMGIKWGQVGEEWAKLGQKGLSGIIVLVGFKWGRCLLSILMGEVGEILVSLDEVGLCLVLVFKICNKTKNFRKDLPFTSVQSSKSDQGGAPPLPIPMIMKLGWRMVMGEFFLMENLSNCN